MKSVCVLFLAIIAAASAGISRSDVHFNMGGSRIAYSINHRPDPSGGPNAFVSVSRTEPVHHHPVHGSVHQTPAVHDSVHQTPAVHDSVHHTPAVHDSVHQTPVHVPAHVITSHHVPTPVHPASALHTPLSYAEPLFHGPFTSMRHPKYYPDPFYPYAYAHYYPHAGHQGFIFVA